MLAGCHVIIGGAIAAVKMDSEVALFLGGWQFPAGRDAVAGMCADM
jgi:hypothetical protein